MPEVMVLVKEEILQAVQRRKLHTDFRRCTQIAMERIRVYLRSSVSHLARQ